MPARYNDGCLLSFSRMASTDDHLLLLSDAVDRTLVNPTGSYCWINLMAHTREITNAALLAQVIAAISNHVADHGLGGFYRAVFLDVATGDFRHFGRAAAILAGLAPRDQDRLTAFFHVVWQRALLYANDRPTFVHNLRTMGLPALAPLIGYDDDVAPRPRAATALRRVALVSAELTSPRHPPTRMLLEQAEVLARQGIAVGLFTCQETMGPDFAHLLGRPPANVPTETALDAWLAAGPAGAKLAVANHRLSMVRRWQSLLPHIDAYAPDLVMFIGLHSGLVNTLYRRYPVLGMATNSVQPMVATDVWLTAQAALHGKQGDFWQAQLPASVAYYHPFRARRRACGAPAARATLQIPADAILMISIGSHLDVKIDGPWADSMCEAMRRHPRLHWLLLGGSGQRPRALAEFGDGRVVCMAHVEGAMELMAMSDIYINPPMMGGGLSVTEAMSLGLPVLSLADCDGGDKLGAAAAGDLPAYFAQLDIWALDAAARSAAGAHLRQHFAQAIDLDASGPSLLAACRLAQQRYQRRMTAANS